MCRTSLETDLHKRRPKTVSTLKCLANILGIVLGDWFEDVLGLKKLYFVFTMDAAFANNATETYLNEKE